MDINLVNVSCFSVTDTSTVLEEPSGLRISMCNTTLQTLELSKDNLSKFRIITDCNSMNNKLFTYDRSYIIINVV